MDPALIWEEAERAGRTAALRHKPRPVMYNDSTGRLRSLAPVGPCGLAWINIKPVRDPMAKYLVKAGLARRDSAEGGVTVWIADYGQSMELKFAHARAAAAVLVRCGIRANAQFRED